MSYLQLSLNPIRVLPHYNYNLYIVIYKFAYKPDKAQSLLKYKLWINVEQAWETYT